MMLTKEFTSVLREETRPVFSYPSKDDANTMHRVGILSMANTGTSHRRYVYCILSGLPLHVGNRGCSSAARLTVPCLHSVAR